MIFDALAWIVMVYFGVVLSGYVYRHNSEKYTEAANVLASIFFTVIYFAALYRIST